jgi:hypothetical protein
MCKKLIFTLRTEHTLRVFEKKVFRRLFRCEKEEVTGGWRTLHNEVLACSIHMLLREIKWNDKETCVQRACWKWVIGNFVWGRPRRVVPLIRIDGRKILKCVQRIRCVAGCPSTMMLTV